MAKVEYFGERIADDPEWARLRALERAYDPISVRLLGEVAGPAPGARCLEIGAGAGSVTRWLAERVGPEGGVVAVDLSCRFLEELPPNVEMIEADVAEIDLGEARFDVIHHRAVLAYVAQREEVTARAVRALRPGGWLIAEEPILPPAESSWVRGDTDDGVVVRTLTSLRRFLDATGMDAGFGLRLPSLLEECGLVGVEYSGAVFVARGAGIHGDYMWPMLPALKPLLVELGGVTEEDIDRATVRLRDPRLSTLTPIMVSAWGQQAL